MLQGHRYRALGKPDDFITVCHDSHDGHAIRSDHELNSEIVEDMTGGRETYSNGNRQRQGHWVLLISSP